MLSIHRHTYTCIHCNSGMHGATVNMYVYMHAPLHSNNVRELQTAPKAVSPCLGLISAVYSVQGNNTCSHMHLHTHAAQSHVYTHTAQSHTNTHVHIVRARAHTHTHTHTQSHARTHTHTHTHTYAHLCTQTVIYLQCWHISIVICYDKQSMQIE